MAQPQALPIVALLEETVFPGEERALPAHVCDGATHAWLAALPLDSPLMLVTVTAAAEVPLLVGGRHGTHARWLGHRDGAPAFVGVERLKIVKAKGQKVPYLADLEPPTQVAPSASQLARPLAGAVLALAHTDAELTLLAAAALRLLDPAAPRRALAEGDLVAALTEATRAHLGDAPGHAALRDLEQHVATLARQQSPSKAVRQRLHSAVVEVARRLDVYDTTQARHDDLDELDILRRRLDQGLLPQHARAAAEREFKLLRGMKTDNHEYASHLRLLQLLGRLAWAPDVLPPIDLRRVQAVLDRDHTGLVRAKRRVLEHLAVRALGGEGRSTVLCLAGPPGVGKTSIARAMAEALGRPYVRIALGGVHDQAELRGHRITYSASRPGRLIDALAQVRSRSALVLLDELDKVGADRSRDVTGALLEILDPEQNHGFVDHFLGVEYDLSDCLFVATANDVQKMPDFLRDRLEILELDGYTTREKIDIARRHLAPSLAKEHGIGALALDDALLADIIEGWTREAGVRQLRRELAGFYRERAVERLLPPDEPRPTERAIVADDLERVLGPLRFRRHAQQRTLAPGVATGLSVSGHGGQLLPLELVSLGRAEGGRGRLTMTGQLGQVMQESAQLVRAHVLAYRQQYGVGPELAEQDLHLHAPEGAVPKDGPSAGVALFLALVSLASQRALPADVAVTGELDLSGRVLPVGGIRAKCLAAERADLRRVFVPAANRADVPSDLTIAVTYLERAEDALAAFT